jgi:hypothetical protein
MIRNTREESLRCSHGLFDRTEEIYVAPSDEVEACSAIDNLDDAMREALGK